jgi:hypothetical protein
MLLGETGNVDAWPLGLLCEAMTNFLSQRRQKNNQELLQWAMIFTLCQMAHGRNRRDVDALVDLGRACQVETAERFMNGVAEAMAGDVRTCDAGKKEPVISADNFQASLAHLNQATTFLKAAVRFSKHAFLTPLEKGSVLKDECTEALFIVVKIRHQNECTCSVSCRPLDDSSDVSPDNSSDDSVDEGSETALH